MEIEEVRNKKAFLEQKFLKEIQNFEEETGLVVSLLDIQRQYLSNAQGDKTESSPQKVYVTVDLE